MVMPFTIVTAAVSSDKNLSYLTFTMRSHNYTDTCATDDLYIRARVTDTDNTYQCVPQHGGVYQFYRSISLCPSCSPK